MIEELAPADPAESLEALRLRELCCGEQVIVLANREPFSHEAGPDGRMRVTHSTAGLVKAVEPLVAACCGVWVGHGSGARDRDVPLERDGLAVPPGAPQYRLRRVWLSPEEYQGYYCGFANEALWPLCHRVHVAPVFRADDYNAYWSANARFVDAVCDEAITGCPLVLVQDYHFALAPLLLKEKLPRSTVVTFWHIPWPQWQSFEVCPWGQQLLGGLLGSDILAFQTPVDCRNFLECVERSLEAHIDRDDYSITHAGRRIRLRVYPASIEWPSEPLDAPGASAVRDAVLKRLCLHAGVRLVVGVDRFDYTKGIEQKLLAIERVLEHYPEYVEQLVFLQLVEPSRSALSAYVQLRTRVVDLAGRINARFARGSYQPVRLLEGYHAPSDVCSVLTAADVCYVGSLHDGMNLVSKEFVAARSDERGVLVLSAFAGSARELTEAISINPYDIDATAVALGTALAMPLPEQRARMRVMREAVAQATAYHWASRMLSDAMAVRRASRLNGPGAAAAHLSARPFGDPVLDEIV